MDLEQVDVVRVQALEAALDLVEDRLTGEPRLVHVVARVLQPGVLHGVEADVVRHQDEALGQNRDAVTRDVELDGSTSRQPWPREKHASTDLLDSLSDEDFRLAVAVHVGRVPRPNEGESDQSRAWRHFRTVTHETPRFHAASRSGRACIIRRWHDISRSRVLWETHLLLINDPGRPLAGAERHGSENRVRNAEAALAEAALLDLRRRGHDRSSSWVGLLDAWWSRSDAATRLMYPTLRLVHYRSRRRASRRPRSSCLRHPYDTHAHEQRQHVAVSAFTMPDARRRQKSNRNATRSRRPMTT
jgi:hypothetical protein